MNKGTFEPDLIFALNQGKVKGITSFAPIKRSEFFNVICLSGSTNTSDENIWYPAFCGSFWKLTILKSVVTQLSFAYIFSSSYFIYGLPK